MPGRGFVHRGLSFHDLFWNKQTRARSGGLFGRWCGSKLKKYKKSEKISNWPGSNHEYYAYTNTLTMPALASKPIAVQPRSKLNLALILFCCLQALDLLSTILVFARGGVELNPVVRALMPWTGRIAAVVASKAVLVAIIWTFARRRKRVLLFADVFYAAVVVWNVMVLNGPK